MNFDHAENDFREYERNTSAPYLKKKTICSSCTCSICLNKNSCLSHLVNEMQCHQTNTTTTY